MLRDTNENEEVVALCELHWTTLVDIGRGQSGIYGRRIKLLRTRGRCGRRSLEREKTSREQMGNPLVNVRRYFLGTTCCEMFDLQTRLSLMLSICSRYDGFDRRGWTEREEFWLQEWRWDYLKQPACSIMFKLERYLFILRTFDTI